MAFTRRPSAGQTVDASPIRTHLQALIEADNRWISGFGITSSGTSLSVDIATGVALVDGAYVGDSGDSAQSVTLPASSTSFVYLVDDGSLTNRTTNDPSATELLIWEVVTDASGVTSTTDHRSSDVVIPDTFTAAGLAATTNPITGPSVELSGSTPYLEFHDSVGGNYFRLWARNGKVQVTNQSGGTVYTNDLSSISNPVDLTSQDATKDKTISNLYGYNWETHRNASAPHPGHEDKANKGVASGYASLDATSLLEQAAKLIQNAAPGTTAGAIGVSGSNLQFYDGTALQTAERQANKGVASGYASLDSASLLVQKAKRLATTTQSGTDGGVWVASGEMNFYSGATAYVAEKTSRKGVANGYASLDASALVPTAQVPVLDASHLAASSVGSTQIATGAVTSGKIATGAVDSTKLASGAVTSVKIANGAVGTTQVDSTIATAAALSSHTSNTSNPHGVTAAQVGALPTSGGTMSGNIVMAQNQITGFVVENRTSDPASPAPGQMWYRSDLG